MIFAETIKSPTLILNEKISRKNISVMAEKALRNGVKFRPHFKTHLSTEVGNWYKEAGVDAITVSSVSMAQHFSQNGWDDITIAFPVNRREIEEIDKLSLEINLNLLVECSETLSFIGENLSGRAGVFLKIDTGYHRTGIAHQDYQLTEEIINNIDKYENLIFKGFLTHAGHTYKAKSREDITTIHEESVIILGNLKKRYQKRYPHLILSAGDTPSCSIVDDFRGLDEIRPGNFVFYDLMQVNIGSCTYADIAVAMACPVVAKHTDRQELVIYGGGIHFSKEHFYRSDNMPCYGLVVEPLDEGWSDPVENVWISALSQEHGTIKSLNRAYFDKTEIGDLVLILPVHSCLTSNLMRGSRMTDSRIYF